MWASLSPKYFSRGSPLPLRSICLDSQTWLTQPLHLVLGGMLGLRHRIERAAEFDDVPVAVVPFLQQLEIVPDFVDRHRGPRPFP